MDAKADAQVVNRQLAQREGEEETVVQLPMAHAEPIMAIRFAATFLRVVVVQHMDSGMISSLIPQFISIINVS